MTKISNYLTAFAAATFGCLAAIPASADTTPRNVIETDVIETYADIALAKYEDALATAKALRKAVDQLIAEPTAAKLVLARKAWLAARVPYQQTEVYRFGNAIVDDWEGKVNAWPLDEGLIDYVSDDYGEESEQNSLYAANIIANPKLKIAGKDVDATRITKALLSDVLQEADGVEANVATGYHAIEFLLWGQDLNGNGAGAGNRPATDFDPKNCTGGNCDRRAQYLKIATELMIDDLTWMVSQWTEDGAARHTLMMQDPAQSLIAIFTGMGSLSYGELAGERMKLGLLLHNPEEEHDCFADNTHNSHYYNVVGIQNVYLGRYKRIDGSIVQGASVSDLVKAADYSVHRRLQVALADTVAKFQVLVARAETTEAYDQMISEGNTAGNQTVQTAIDALLAQTKEIERAVAALNIKAIAFEGSDSLDNPSTVAQ
ncbi:MAG: imelysin family protein [Pseudomonadota bacterium]